MWRRWVLANVIGEIVGFGLAVAIGMVAASAIEQLVGAWWMLAAMGLILLVGTAEGGAVGLAQWLVLRRAAAVLGAPSWIGATVLGATMAWGVGMLIGSSAGEWFGAAELEGPLLIGGMVIGTVAGILLAVPQAIVLRRVVRQAGWWVPVHALAWSFGMLVAFAGIASIPPDAPPWLAALAGGTIGLAMGATVAMITGLALVWLFRRNRPEPPELAIGPHARSVQ